MFIYRLSSKAMLSLVESEINYVSLKNTMKQFFLAMVWGYNDYVKYEMSFRPCLQSWGSGNWSYSWCTRRGGWWRQMWRQPQLNWQIADWEPSHWVYPFQNQAYWILLAFATKVLYWTLFISIKLDFLKKRTVLYPVRPIILQSHLLLSSYLLL